MVVIIHNFFTILLFLEKILLIIFKEKTSIVNFSNIFLNFDHQLYKIEKIQRLF